MYIANQLGSAIPNSFIQIPSAAVFGPAGIVTRDRTYTLDMILRGVNDLRIGDNMVIKFRESGANG